jgi:hypothetical protein
VLTAKETEEKTEGEVPEEEGESEQAGRLIAKRRQGFSSAQPAAVCAFLGEATALIFPAWRLGFRFVYDVVTGEMGGWLPVYH